jgi:hypothetical protein
MCLKYLLSEEIDISGYGYKIVIPTDNPDVFLSYYKRFVLGKGGNLSNIKSETKQFIIQNPDVFCVESVIQYKIMQTSIVKNFIRTYTQYTKQEYIAGIHLYKSLKTASIYYGYSYGLTNIIKCHYNKAIAHDPETVVALEVTPVELIY